jgi:hypothetical protein
VVREGEISNLKGLNELKRARLQDPTLGNDLQLKAEFAEILLLASVDGEMRMPGSTPPTSQLDWLSSTTAMIVLCGRGRRGTCSSRSAGASRHTIGYMQRRSCHLLAARPIESSGTQLRTGDGCGLAPVVSLLAGVRKTWKNELIRHIRRGGSIPARNRVQSPTCWVDKRRSAH